MQHSKHWGTDFAVFVKPTSSLKPREYVDDSSPGLQEDLEK